MSVNHYINKIAGKIKCSSAKKKEIKKELRSDIELRLEQGEKPENIISEMGSIKEVADSFNENISQKEKQKYRTQKALTIVGSVIVSLALVITLLYVILPKSMNIDESEYFDKHQVEDTVKQTVIWLDEGNSDRLQEHAIAQMQEYLTGDEIANMKAQVADDWGERQALGAIYMVEIVQGTGHYAVAEIAVSYENISVIYRLTYDTDLKLAGIYVR